MTTTPLLIEANDAECDRAIADAEALAAEEHDNGEYTGQDHSAQFILSRLFPGHALDNLTPEESTEAALLVYAWLVEGYEAQWKQLAREFDAAGNLLPLDD